ncbi:hypothetical protein OIV83_006460, partial [Microbotryomycetes sp. JL201]
SVAYDAFAVALERAYPTLGEALIEAATGGFVVQLRPDLEEAEKTRLLTDGLEINGVMLKPYKLYNDTEDDLIAIRVHNFFPYSDCVEGLNAALAPFAQVLDARAEKVAGTQKKFTGRYDMYLRIRDINVLPPAVLKVEYANTVDTVKIEIVSKHRRVCAWCRHADHRREHCPTAPRCTHCKMRSHAPPACPTLKRTNFAAPAAAAAAAAQPQPGRAPAQANAAQKSAEPAALPTGPFNFETNSRWANATASTSRTPRRQPVGLTTRQAAETTSRKRHKPHDSDEDGGPDPPSSSLSNRQQAPAVAALARAPGQGETERDDAQSDDDDDAGDEQLSEAESRAAEDEAGDAVGTSEAADVEGTEAEDGTVSPAPSPSAPVAPTPPDAAVTPARVTRASKAAQAGTSPVDKRHTEKDKQTPRSAVAQGTQQAEGGDMEIDA